MIIERGKDKKEARKGEENVGKRREDGKRGK